MCLLGLSLSPPAMAAPSATISQEFTYLVVARDLTRHKVTLRYTGETVGDVYQSGSAAHGLKLQDTRKCHWSFSNRYRMEHVITADARTGLEERIDDGLRLQQGSDFPLHAPIVNQLAGMAAELDSWIAFQRLEAIFKSEDYRDPAFPRTAVALVADLAVAVPTVMFRGLARVTGLRKGVNCGEAKSAIGAARDAHQDALRINMSIVPKLEYYLNSINLYRHWRYIEPRSGAAVGALIVYPGRDWPDYVMASSLIWREIRQNLLGDSVRGIAAPEPTELETREFRTMLANDPDGWIEALIARHATAFDEKRFDALRDSVARSLAPPPMPPLAAGGKPAPVLPKMPGEGDYAVTWRDYPAPLTPEHVSLDHGTAEKILRCGHGRLYSVAFSDTSMSVMERAQAEAMLERNYGNQLTGVMAQLGQLQWVAERLPETHPLHERMRQFAAEIAPQLATVTELGQVFNPRNLAYRTCLAAK